jgi:hypothetical protein
LGNDAATVDNESKFKSIKLTVRTTVDAVALGCDGDSTERNIFVFDMRVGCIVSTLIL